MASARSRDLTRRECLELIRGRRPVRMAAVSVGGRAPVRVACFPLPDGDIAIPTGTDQSLARAAAGRPVTVQFEQDNPAEQERWVVRGAGKARPLGQRDRPRTAVDTGIALAMTYAFENGIRIDVDELVGERVSGCREPTSW
ncbi:MAG: hypothetical protein GEV28_00945 [Actinophytocola sp.]|uniref:hypothetical protein n=1 Tax=Actinophytocola sp. TaxID=1872138 RepID=UPI001327CE42|nr:hypothetical protein [Actinophytocola sp.]MPZ79029.1 hypothetical protein [Actinophytocola sp.]